MTKQSNTFTTTHTAGNQEWVRSKTFTQKIFLLCLAGLLVVAANTGCKKEKHEYVHCGDHEHNSDSCASDPFNLPAQTVQELKAAKAATARYRTFENALTDGYADINVVMENMGYHYMKTALVDTVFQIEKPEILVYNKNMNGKMELVAIEYAVPIALKPDAAPEGFTGSADVWNRHTGFGLWLLHAWVWEYNPLGVFNATNPLVHLH